MESVRVFCFFGALVLNVWSAALISKRIDFSGNKKTSESANDDGSIFSSFFGAFIILTMITFPVGGAIGIAISSDFDQSLSGGSSTDILAIASLGVSAATLFLVDAVTNFFGKSSRANLANDHSASIIKSGNSGRGSSTAKFISIVGFVASILTIIAFYLEYVQ